MIEKKRKRKHLNDASVDDSWKPTPEELEVAKFLYRKLPAKEGRLSGTFVRYFHPNDAIDLLMDSPWAKSQPNDVKQRNVKPRLFGNQAAAIAFMTILLQKQVFHQAIRVKKKHRDEVKSSKSKVKKSPELKPSGTRENADGPAVSQADTELTDKPDGAATQEKETKEASISAEPAPSDISHSISTSNKSSSSSTSSKPIRLEMAKEQIFTLDDPLSVYVWLYEPPPGLFNWLAGSALIIGIILCCLFPIWPTQLRVGAYYLTLCASGLFGLLLGLALVRLCLYVIGWAVTMGRYGFWLFPNYFEDCGFFESFKPVYVITPLGSTDKPKAVGERGREKSRSKNSTPVKTTTAAVSAPDVGKVAEPLKDSLKPVVASTMYKDSLGKQE
ncbi:unnamed protein product [Calicophoron daubneyi]|uniref:Translocation protein SEC62 n=1 Tax=Calicophoron daubneyi TaxID=300641 RepID=A0AAV2SZ97_CALDB